MLVCIVKRARFSYPSWYFHLLAWSKNGKAPRLHLQASVPPALQPPALHREGLFSSSAVSGIFEMHADESRQNSFFWVGGGRVSNMNPRPQPSPSLTILADDWGLKTIPAQIQRRHDRGLEMEGVLFWKTTKIVPKQTMAENSQSLAAASYVALMRRRHSVREMGAAACAGLKS